MPRKFAQDRASSRMVRSSMLVFVTCDRCASRPDSFVSSTSAMSVAHLGVAAERPVGGDEHIDGVASLGVLGEHAAAAVLDVVGMGAEGEDVHLFRLGREARPRAPLTENAEGLIAVNQ